MQLAVTSAFSDDIAIDLGTANTLVHVAGRGIIIDEPSAVAVRTHRASREILAVGRKAKLLIGRAPESIELVRPLRDGVISVVKIFTVAKPAWIASASWPGRSIGSAPSTMMCCA